MGQKFFTFALAIVVGVASGVFFTNRPAVKASLDKQQAILETLQDMKNQMGDSGLTSKIAKLEDRLDAIEGIFKNIQAPANNRPAPTMPTVDYSKRHDIPLAHSFVIGNKNAPITIVAFTDFQCPYCEKFYAPIAQLIKEMPDKVNLVIKNYPLPFHPNARPASKFALAAGEQGKYGEAVNAMLTNIQDVNDAGYKKIADEFKLDWNKIQADLKNNDAKYEDMITKDMNLGEQVGVQGTPTYYLNGKMANVRDLQGWKDLIEKELQEKK